MTIDIFYYLGAIVAQVGMAILAIGLAWIRIKDMDVSVRERWEKRIAILATALILSGIIIQLAKLLETNALQ